MRMFPRRVWAGVLIVLLSACAPAAVGPTSTPFTSPTAMPAPAVTPSPPDTRPEGGASVQSLIDQAVADLAKRLSVTPSEIEVVSSEEVIWNDGSLGCPEPGMAYIQILIEGHRIILKHGDKTYDYHAGPGSVFLCENGTRPTPVP
jgi:hypothetical protein